ncbi:unnamed protein product [Pleuronectes platessa]|uniref:Uncharacterized protein n=1 Tax=Pleuronectes platessa TaxID=8262 RepID=A0A9N7W041_PLEPL|nr:unnamed protein product [Pleuronectes platessa]
MRHFTAFTAIRQDGPLALSALTGVVSLFCGSSRLRAIASLRDSTGLFDGKPKTTRVSGGREMTTAGSR